MLLAKYRYITFCLRLSDSSIVIMISQQYCTLYVLLSSVPVDWYSIVVRVVVVIDDGIIAANRIND